MTNLVDLLKSRKIERVYYFHTDHFEPWSFEINEESALAVERMAAMARTSRFAQRMSLFYSVFVPYRFEPNAESKVNGFRNSGDGVVFFNRRARQEELAREVIRPLVAQDCHEIHLHTHHEFWTRNNSNFDSPVSKWVNTHSTAAADEARFNLHLRLCREAISRETGKPFEQWAFIHGNWALNASDPLICHIENEMDLLLEQGCVGDFTFPAGRSYCDPTLETPFTCRPIAVTRAYDDPDAEAHPIGKATAAMTSDRFFIWNSPIKAPFSSLDYYSAANRKRLNNPERVVEEWLSRSVAIAGCLFVKTHAHSMKREYKLTEPDSVIPHCFPAVVATLECLSRTCDEARVPLLSVTVSNVLNILRRLDSGLAVGESPPDTYRVAQVKDVKEQPRGRASINPTAIDHLEMTGMRSGQKPYILERPFASDGGAAWVARLPVELHSLTDNDSAPVRSPLRLLENGHSVGPDHIMHQRIRDQGGGLHSFWKKSLRFSTPDGTNPNSNGRTYSIVSEATSTPPDSAEQSPQD